jgi:MFS family permease
MALKLPIEPGVFLFAVGYFSLIPLLQQLVYWRLCNINGCSRNNSGTMATYSYTSSIDNSAGSCYRVTSAIQDKVESDASHWIFYLNVAASAPAVLTSLVFGPLSDKLGRKPFLALACSSIVLKSGWILAFWYWSLPIAFLLGGQVLAGLTGYDTGLSMFFAYISDCSSLENRTKRLGLIDGMVYSGAAVGFLIGNLWISGENFDPPFWFILSCGLVAMLYVVIFIQESVQLDVESSRPQCFHVCGSAVCNVVRCCSALHLQPCLLLGFSAFLILETVASGISDIIVLYTLDWPLCWTSELLAYFLASLMAGFAVLTVLLLPILKKQAVSDPVIVVSGLLLDAASLCVLGIAKHNWMMFVGEIYLNSCFIFCTNYALRAKTF